MGIREVVVIKYECTTDGLLFNTKEECEKHIQYLKLYNFVNVYVGTCGASVDSVAKDLFLEKEKLKEILWDI